MHNITFILIKVKGHSDDALNQHADELARQGLTSPAFIISPGDIRFNTRASETALQHQYWK
jgi:ribonuclease HI